jgi:hypothetical protein
MSGLVKLQNLFQDHVLHVNADAATAFVGDETAAVEARLGVYYDAYRLRLIECLGNDFPVLRAVLGAAEFESTGLRYVAEHPSHNPNVRWIGQHMTDFLTADSDSIERPYLAEIARFEWSRGLAFDAPDAPVMKPDDLARTPAEDWPTLTLNFHPSVQRATFAWNIGPISHAVGEAEPMPDPATLETPEQWALWRRDTTVYWRSLGEPEAFALDAFRGGENFGDVCSGLCEWIAEERVPDQITGMLRQWVAEGLLIN